MVSHPALIASLHFIPRSLIELGAAFGAVWLVRLAMRFVEYERDFRHVPGPKPSSWLWGSEWDVYRSEPGRKYLEWREAFGRVYKFRTAFRSTMLTVSDPLAVNYMIGPHHVYDFPKPEGGRKWFLNLLGGGVLYEEGEAHGRLRKILGPAFNQHSVRNLCSIFFDSATKTANKWNEQFDALNTKDKDPSLGIDVQYWANRISLDSIGLAGFSYDFDTLNNPKSTGLAALLDSLTDSSASFGAFVIHCLVFLFPAILKMPSQRGKMLAEVRRVMGEITSKMWKDAQTTESNDTPSTVLEALVQNEQEDPENHLTDAEVNSEMMTLIFAGYDTTSTAISWALHELSRNPEVQAKLREEVSASTADATFDQLEEKLPYLDAVVDEVIRLHPPILELHRVSLKDDVLPLSEPLPNSTETTLQIPKGTVIAIPLNAMQREKKVWGADADVFRPERWLEYELERTVNEKDKQHPHEHVRRELMAFSAGTRICIGRIFALIETKAVISTLIRQFTFEAVHDIEEFVSFVVRPRVKGEERSRLPVKVKKVGGM